MPYMSHWGLRFINEKVHTPYAYGMGVILFIPQLYLWGNDGFDRMKKLLTLSYLFYSGWVIQHQEAAFTRIFSWWVLSFGGSTFHGDATAMLSTCTAGTSIFWGGKIFHYCVCVFFLLSSMGHTPGLSILNLSHFPFRCLLLRQLMKLYLMLMEANLVVRHQFHPVLLTSLVWASFLIRWVWYCGLFLGIVAAVAAQHYGDQYHIKG